MHSGEIFEGMSQLATERPETASVAAVGSGGDGRHHAGRHCKAFEFPPPERLGLGGVSGLEPTDVVGEWGNRRQRRLLALQQRLVGTEDVAEHIRRRPTVLEQVMLVPQEHVVVG